MAETRVIFSPDTQEDFEPIHVSSVKDPDKIITFTCDSELQKHFYMAVRAMNKVLDAVGLIEYESTAEKKLKTDVNSEQFVESIESANAAIKNIFHEELFALFFFSDHWTPNQLREFNEIINELLDRISLYTLYVGHYNYYEEVLRLCKFLRKNLEVFIEFLLKDDKKYKSLVLILQEALLLNLREIAYCHAQLKNYIDAGIVSAEAIVAAKIFRPGHLPDLELKFYILHESIMAIYEIEDKTLDNAKKRIDRILNIYESEESSPQQQTRRKNSAYRPDLLAVACDKLATAYFLQQNYPEAIFYLEHQVNILKYIHQTKYKPFYPHLMKRANNRLYAYTLSNPGLFYSHLVKSDQKLQNLTKLVLSQKIAKIRSILENETLQKLFIPKDSYTIDVTKGLLTLHCKDKSIKNLLVHHFSVYAIKDESKQSASVLIDLNEIVVDHLNLALIDAITQFKTSPSQPPRPSSPKSPKLVSASSPPLSPNMIFEALISSQNLYKSRPAPRRKTSFTESPVLETPAEPAPEVFSWSNGMKYDATTPDETRTVYALAKPPCIPSGHWYAYLAESELLKEQMPDDLLKSVKHILDRGLLSSRGQGIKCSKHELGHDSFKIRLLGNEGKGDVRVYGQVEESIEKNGTCKKLIRFDRVSFHAHKPHKHTKLPNMQIALPKNKP